MRWVQFRVYMFARSDLREKVMKKYERILSNWCTQWKSSRCYTCTIHKSDHYIRYSEFRVLNPRCYKSTVSNKDQSVGLKNILPTEKTE